MVKATAALAAVASLVAPPACGERAQETSPAFCAPYTRARAALDQVFEPPAAPRLEPAASRLADLTRATDRAERSMADAAQDAHDHWDRFARLTADANADAAALRDEFNHVREALEPIDARCDL